MSSPPQDPSRRSAIAGPLVLLLAGLALSALAQTQPAFVADRIGPGLFAQWLSAGVVATSLLWLSVALVSASRAPRRAAAGNTPAPDAGHARLLPGIALLGSVALFLALVPTVGLVGSAAVAAALAAVGAGERAPVPVALSAATGGALALAIGTFFLPPTTRIFPWSPF